MEWQTIPTKQKVLKQVTLTKGKTKEIIVNKYYDLDGDIINEGTDTTKFDSEKDFKIISKTRQIQVYDSEPWEVEDWEIYVDGKRFDDGYELTGYALEPDRIVLHACTGAG